MQIKIIKPKYEIITPAEWLVDADKLIEAIGRLSHKSESKITEKSSKKFIQKWAFKHGHMSMLEFTDVIVRLTLSRNAANQIVRHRIGSYMQESQRYVNYSKNNFLCVVPPEKIESLFEDGESIYLNDLSTYENSLEPDVYLWLESCMLSYLSYLELLNSGWRPEDARSVLHGCVSTEIVVKYNLSSWVNFFNKRCDKSAQSEIRKIATDIRDEFSMIMPNIFQ